MNLDRHQDSIVPYLDGELSAAERETFERAMESSEELRSAVEYERRVGEFTRGALTTEADAAAKGRLMSALRDAAAGGVPREDAGSDRGRVVAFPVRVIGWPTAAAVAGLLLWLGGVFDATPEESGRGRDENVFASVMSVDTDFGRRVEALDGERDERLRRVLASEPSHRVWRSAPRDERMAELQCLLDECLPNGVPMPRLSSDFELVGYREKALPLKSYPFKLPHVVFSNGRKELSIYVLCGSKADAVEKELARSNDAHLKGMSGCTQGGWLARRYGDVLLVFVSKMKFGLMCDFARQF